MQIYAAFMLAGVFTTLLIPETKRKTLEELAGEYDLGGESMVVEEVHATPEKQTTGSGNSV